MREIILIAHNIRSCHNVGALLRTAEGLGVQTVYLTGYTPYPLMADDDRLPHLAQKITKQITKTALGAERTQAWIHDASFEHVHQALVSAGFPIVAVEQTADSTALPDYHPPEKIALLVGREVEGIEPEILALCSQVIEIPMFGSKESFNVVQAAAMTLYHCRFFKS